MRFSTPSRLALRLCCLLAGGRAASAQAPDPKTTPGIWRTMVRLGVRVQTPSEKQLTGELEQVAALVQVLPMFNPPIGFTVEPHIMTGARDPRTKVMTGEYFLYVIPHTRKPDGSIDITRMGTGFEGLQFGAAANDVDCIISNDNSAHFEGPDADLHYAPRVGSFAGHTTYNDCIFLTKRPMPPFIPASRERVMKAVIQQYRELPEMAKDYQKQLDAMSAAERASPAWMDLAGFGMYTMERKVGGALMGQPGQKDRDGNAFQALVQYNPAFFDAARPGEIQSLTITVPCSARFRSQSQWCGGFGTIFDRLLGSLDWAALSAIERP